MAEDVPPNVVKTENPEHVSVQAGLPEYKSRNRQTNKARLESRKKRKAIKELDEKKANATDVEKKKLEKMVDEYHRFFEDNKEALGDFGRDPRDFTNIDEPDPMELDSPTTADHPQMAGGMLEDDLIDPNAAPLTTGLNEELNPLAGLVKASVAMRKGKKLHPVYINKHGDAQHEWYTFGSLENEADSGLLDVGNPKNRQISAQHDDMTNGPPKEKDFHGIIQVAFEYDKDTKFPLEAVEALNPVKVKKTDKYPTMGKRRAFTKAGGKLDAFPTTMVFVQWRGDRKSSWELASELKALKSKSVFEIEKHIYEVALYRARRVEKVIAHNRNRVSEYSQSRLGTEHTPHYQTPGVVQSVEEEDRTSPSPDTATNNAQGTTSTTPGAANAPEQVGTTLLPTPSPSQTPVPGDTAKFQKWLKAYCEASKQDKKNLDKVEVGALYAASLSYANDSTLWN